MSAKPVAARNGDADSDDAAMLADRRGDRQGHGSGAAADFEHALAGDVVQTRQQQRHALLVAPFPEPRSGDPTRPGHRIPIAALRRILVKGFPGHPARSPVSLRTASIVAHPGTTRPEYRPNEEPLLFPHAPFIHACRGRWIVAVVPPSRVVEMNDKIAVVGGDRLVKDQSADARPIAELAPLQEGGAMG